jgi:hypothetical protein
MTAQRLTVDSYLKLASQYSELSQSSQLDFAERYSRIVRKNPLFGSVNDYLTGSIQESKESSEVDSVEVRSDQSSAVLTERLVVHPSSKTKLSSAVVIMECEGFVERVEQDVFFARLNLLRGSETIESFDSEIPIDLVSPGDRQLMVEGSIFRWSTGYDSYNGTRSRFSRLVFRRLPAWSRPSLSQAQQSMHDLFGEIEWADSVAD